MYNYIDLFAGAGGLSEGFISQGFNPIAHIEMDKHTCDTLKTRIAYYTLKDIDRLDIYYNYLKGIIDRNTLWGLLPDKKINSVINTEISKTTIESTFKHIDALIVNKQKIDLIIGGPPCQAYSLVGRARDPKKMEDDHRNHLYKLYVNFLNKYKPKMFVFENVPGILSAKNGQYFELIKDAISAAGYKFDYKILNAKDFNVLQDRKRVILIGWKQNTNIDYPQFETQNNNYKLSDDLFSDLQPLKQGQGILGATMYYSEATEYLKSTGIRKNIDFTTQHISRAVNTNDLEIYKIAINEWEKGKRLKYTMLPPHLIKHKNLTSFQDRFNVVNGNGLSHTVVAHIAMDGHYYIYPNKNQNRSITIREAARIQSFPDDFFFEGGRTAAFRQIGNAVPPLMAARIASKINEMI